MIQLLVNPGSENDDDNVGVARNATGEGISRTTHNTSSRPNTDSDLDEDQYCNK